MAITLTLVDDEIVVSWDPIQDAVSYNLYWSKDKKINNNVTRIAEIVETTYNTGIINNGSNNGTYYFTVTGNS